MKQIVAVLAMLLLSAAAAAAGKLPERVTQFIDGFKAEVKRAGLDPARCVFRTLQKNGTYYVGAKCEELPAKCVFEMHPKLPVARPYECGPNEEYKEKAPGAQVDNSK